MKIVATSIPKTLDEYQLALDAAWAGGQALGKALASQPAAPVQELEKGCHRSHPHENMDAMCELRTEIARLTNENARLKAAQRQWVGLTEEAIKDRKYYLYNRNRASKRHTGVEK